MTWTQFMDMHSGGRQKLDWAYIYIEAKEEDAAKVFMHRFGRNPNNITCSCCGEDYSFYEQGDELQQASGFERHCLYEGKERGYIEVSDKYRKLIPFEEWLEDAKDPDSDHLIIYAKDIKPEELKGEAPRRGRLVWVED